ncbi:hypothetical protein RIVM261_044090 [Rivularia sp. IAM M-261]|nr:hypothetical protein CAL7716_084560 [Calothrix sp. PCC 7716]GJD19453.1 hypothetical protein RIVM261_044090 [Rivularia sp. IAM M-261]
MRLLRKFLPITAVIILIVLFNTQSNSINLVLGTGNVAIGGGGYVTGIYLHSKQRDLVYIKTDVGGFYRWNSTNQSWIPLTDHFPLERVNYYGGEAIALDPQNPNTVYIAVGKYASDWWQHKGTIFKSTNQGKTWQKLNLDLKMGGNEPQRWTGERLAINPFNSQLLLFGSRKNGLWISHNSGKTWSQVKSFPGKLKDNLGITVITFNPSVRNQVYAVVYDDGIYQSNDLGITWQKLLNSPAQANRLAIRGNTLYVTHSSGVSKYSNGKWSNITPANNQTAFNALTINPSNSNEIIVTTLTEKALQIYHSRNKGATWKLQNRKTISSVPWWSDYMLSNPSVAAIEFDTHVKNRVWMTDWYGIWRTDNINTNQVVWNNYQKGHEEVVTFGLVSPPVGAPLISALSDVEGFYHEQLDVYPSRMLGSQDKRHNLFQDTYSIAYCETNPKRMVRVGGNRFNNTYGGATSDDGGKTWRQFASFPEKIMPTRVAMSATDPNLFIITVSNGQPLRTTNNGATWQKVSGLPNGFNAPWNWSQPLAADKVSGNTFYYYSNSKLYRSDNGGASFNIASTSIPHADWHSLKTVPLVKGELWLSLDNQGLYHSTDSGKTFLPIKSVKGAHLFSVGKAKNNSKIPTLYLYGKISKLKNGIFRSVDQGKTWKRIGDSKKPIGNDPNVMEASRQKFGLVFIGTNGRGIYYVN